MEIIQNVTEFQIEEPTAVAIGKFDGIHRGHKMLLEEVMKAKEKGLKAAIFTFNPSPGVFFSGKEAKELTTLLEKRELFERVGIDYLVEYPFNKETAAVEPTRYIKEFLLSKMNAKMIVAGEDVSYGNRGMGDAELLCKVAKQSDCEVKIISKLCHEGREISSTYVRSEVEAGHMEVVEALLGEAFFVTGKVLHGNEIGRTIGFPTINMRPEPGKILPPRGVYFSNVYWNEKAYFGVTNIGYKPTVGGELQPGVETFIFDFDEMIYDEEVRVALKHFVRPEQKFDSLEQLKEAISINRMQASEYFSI